MSTPTSQNGASQNGASHRRVLAASLVGTAVEFYDFYIYATAAALVFGPLFFPSEQPGLQLLASYASFSVAFFAAPLGPSPSGISGTGSGASPRWSLRCSSWGCRLS